MEVKSECEFAQSCLTVLDPMGCSLPGSSVHGIFQARVLEWVGIAFSNPRNYSLRNIKVNLKHESIVAQVVYLKVAQSCPTPSDPMDCSLPGSSVHGIFQTRVLEWGAIAVSH